MSRMGRYSVSTLCLLMMSALFSGALAEVPAPHAADLVGLTKQLETAFPGADVRDLQAAPAAGWFQFMLGGSDKVMYIDPSGQYLFAGALFDLRNQKNLTQEFVVAKRQQVLKSVSLDNAIVYRSVQVDSLVKQPLLVFEDPDCPYCQQFHPELKKLVKAGVPVAVYLYPLAKLHPDATRKAVGIWCAENRSELFDRAMNRMEIKDPGQVCSHPLQQNLDLGKQFGVTGTPYFVFPDGRSAMGYKSAAELVRMMGLPESVTQKVSEYP